MRMTTRTWIKKGSELKHEINTTVVQEGHLALWHIGQCGFIIKSSRLVVAVDLVLTELLDKEGRPRTLFPPPFEPQDSPKIDYICCTHSHADHLDFKTIEGVLKANPRAKCIVSPDNKHLIRALNPLQMLFSRQEDLIPLSSDSSLKAIAVAHEEYGFDEKGNSQYLGFLFEFGSIKLFHGGDAIAEPILEKRIQDELPLDVIMLPINGRDEERHERGIIGNMDSREAISLANRIQAKLFIPTHFDMFASNGADLDEFVLILNEVNPSLPYHIPELGKMFTYGKE